MVNGNIYNGVTAVGLIGVWRMMNLEYRMCESEVVQKISEELFQPESHNLIITEISEGWLVSNFIASHSIIPFIGTSKYLANNVATGTSVPKKDVKYHVSGW